MNKAIRGGFFYIGLMAVIFYGGTVTAAEKQADLLEQKDFNQDGKIDTWVTRDNTGSILVIAKDENTNSKPDHWIYYRRNGKAYKREWDRNHDGNPDYRVIEDKGKFLQKHYDDNFDGSYDRTEKAPEKGSSGITKTTAG